MYTSVMSQGLPARRGANAYETVGAQSSSPLELVVMLYDGAIRFTKLAKEAHERGDVRSRSANVSRVLAIVSELQSTLDVEKGLDIAHELDRLYHYIMGRLLDVTTKRDAAALDEILGLLGTLRDGWASASGAVAVRS
jgi:flagellar secretion chaperone FliS